MAVDPGFPSTPASQTPAPVNVDAQELLYRVLSMQRMQTEALVRMEEKVNLTTNFIKTLADKSDQSKILSIGQLKEMLNALIRINCIETEDRIANAVDRLEQLSQQKAEGRYEKKEEPQVPQPEQVEYRVPFTKTFQQVCESFPGTPHGLQLTIGKLASDLTRCYGKEVYKYHINKPTIVLNNRDGAFELIFTRYKQETITIRDFLDLLSGVMGSYESVPEVERYWTFYETKVFVETVSSTDSSRQKFSLVTMEQFLIWINYFNDLTPAIVSTSE